jgi:hypothetical protein
MVGDDRGLHRGMIDRPRFPLVRCPEDRERHALDLDAADLPTLCGVAESERRAWQPAGSTTDVANIDCGECRERAEVIVAIAALGGASVEP